MEYLIGLVSYLVVGFVFILWLFRMARNDERFSFDGIDLILMTIFWPWQAFMFAIHFIAQGFLFVMDELVIMVQSD